MAIRTEDPFVRVACVGIVAWMMGQALVNLGAVLQLLPITGVPLPFVSYGGSSLLPSLMAVGVLLAFARHEAAASLAGDEAARGGPGRGSGRRSRVAAPAAEGGDAMSLHVVLAGGGTAGHIEPALNLADALRRRDPDIGITALGTEKGLEGTLVPARGYELAMIPPVPLPRRPSHGAAHAAGPGPRRAAGRPRRSCATCGADVVVGFGGYVALPAYLAARRTKTPLVVHEANARAGLANRVGARLTPYVAEAVAGQPAAGAGDWASRCGAAIADAGPGRRRAPRPGPPSGWPPRARRCWSSAARRARERINAAVDGRAARAARPRASRCCTRSGPANIDGITDAGRPATTPWPTWTGWTWPTPPPTWCVSRSGALTCAELAAVGLPAIYVPFPIGNGEQRLNALPVVDAGGGTARRRRGADADALLRRGDRAGSRTRDRLARHGPAAAAHGHPRRRRAARRHGAGCRRGRQAGGSR